MKAHLGTGVFPGLISNRPWRIHSHCYLRSHFCLNLSWKLQTVLAFKSLAFLLGHSRSWMSEEKQHHRHPCSQCPQQEPCSVDRQDEKKFCKHQWSCCLSRWNCTCTIRSNRRAAWGPTDSRESDRILACTNSDTTAAVTDGIYYWDFVSHTEETTQQGRFVTSITTFLHPEKAQKGCPGERLWPPGRVVLGQPMEKLQLHSHSCWQWLLEQCSHSSTDLVLTEKWRPVFWKWEATRTIHKGKTKDTWPIKICFRYPYYSIISEHWTLSKALQHR